MTDFAIDYIAAEAVRLPDGRTWRGPNCESNAARALLADGLPPSAVLVFHRNGKPALRGSVTAFAARTWAGAEADPAFRRWRPHPRQNAPSLVAVGTVDGAARFGVGTSTRLAVGATRAGGAA